MWRGWKWRKRRLKRHNGEDIIAKATDAILDGQLYLDASLKCSDVAGRIGTNRTYRERGFGFQDYLSKFRIRYFIQNAGSFKDMRGSEIAERCGFNTPKSMNKYLKDMMGLTLLDYMRRIEKLPCAT